MHAPDFDFDEQPNREENNYRPLSALAMVALGLSLVALTAWIGESFWGFALIGGIVAYLALRRIAASDPPMIGRRLALIALCVSLISLVGGVTNSFVYQRNIDREARQLAEYWFDLQMKGKTEEAVSCVHLSTVDASMLQQFGSGGDAKVDSKVDAKALALDRYRARPEIKTLLALGRRAQVRYYDSESQEHGDKQDSVKQNYAITYDKDGTKTTFFVRLTMERKIPSDKNVGFWMITDIAGGVVPASRQTAPQEG